MNQPFYPGPQQPQQYPQPGHTAQQPGFAGSFVPRPAAGGAKGLAIAGFLCALPTTLYSIVSNIYWLITHDVLLRGDAYVAFPIAQLVFGIAALVLGGIALVKTRRSPQPFTPAALGGAAAFQGAYLLIFGIFNLVSYLIDG